MNTKKIKNLYIKLQIMMGLTKKFLHSQAFWIYVLLFMFVALISILSIVFLILLLVNYRELSYMHYLFINVVSALIIFLIYFFSILIYIYRERRRNIKKSFNYYVENQISNIGVGAIIFNKNDEIIWVSDFIKKIFGSYIVGRRINYISKKFNFNVKKNKNTFKIKYKGLVFLVIINFENNLSIFKDITNEEKMLDKYSAEKIVFGEIEIDNFQQLQISLSDEEIFSAQNTIVKSLNELSEKINFIYWQHINGKYVFFTNKKTLDKMILQKFNFIEKIRSKKIKDNYLSISVGIGLGTTNHKHLQELARKGLKQSCARGGDQVTLMHCNKKPIYYGSKFELEQSTSRVEISKITRLFENKLKNENIKNVIVYGHKLADLDVIGAAMGIKSICEVFNKSTYIGNITFDVTSEKLIKEKYTSQQIANIFITPSYATKISSEDTLVVIVDTSEINRIENIKVFENIKKDNVFIFDHHRIKMQPKEVLEQNIYIDTNASSTCEIVVEMISFITDYVKLDKLSAQMLLNGIFLDTAIFTKSVSARTYTAASFLENQGADSSLAANILKIPKEAASYIKKILNNLQEIKPGFFLATYEGVVPDDYISMAADEILRTKERVASFVIAKSSKDKNLFKMSARSIDINIQRIAEQVGGGGHFSTSAALSSEPLSVFTDNLIQAIMSERRT